MMSDNPSSSNANGAVSHNEDHIESDAECLDPSSLEGLLLVSVIVIRQAIDFLNDHVSADEQLSFRSKYIPGSTIGASHMCFSFARSRC